MGRILIVLATTALVFVAVRYVGFSWFGTLPGDIVAENGETSVKVPFTSLVVLAFALAVAVQILFRLLSRHPD